MLSQSSSVSSVSSVASASSSSSTSSICPALDSSARLSRFLLSSFFCFCFPYCRRCNSLVCLHPVCTCMYGCEYEYILCLLLLVLFVAYAWVELLMALLHWGSGSCSVRLLVRILCEKWEEKENFRNVLSKAFRSLRGAAHSRMCKYVCRCM